jgi:hypothetical protein
VLAIKDGGTEKSKELCVTLPLKSTMTGRLWQRNPECKEIFMTADKKMRLLGQLVTGFN